MDNNFCFGGIYLRKYVDLLRRNAKKTYKLHTHYTLITHPTHTDWDPCDGDQSHPI
jgi:hypothetical protein